MAGNGRSSWSAIFLRWHMRLLGLHIGQRVPSAYSGATENLFKGREHGGKRQ